MLIFMIGLILFIK